MNMLFSSRNFFIFLLAVAMFVMGVTMHKYEYFPYPQVKNLVKSALKTTGNKKRLAFDPAEALSRQYTYDVDKVSLTKDIDTALLPLNVKGIRISDHHPIAKVAGGITTIGNTVIILDRLGNIYSCPADCANVTKLPFPALPNNIADYVMLHDSQLDEQTFRAHRIKYLELSEVLVVSHEYFDKNKEKTRLAVSIIRIDAKSIQPIESWRTIFLSDVEPEGPNDRAGGSLASEGPDKIYVTIGDYDIGPPNVAQDPNSTFGKIMEISLSTAKSRMLSMGHRNPQGLAVTKTGALLSTEHGPAGGDELNLITEGSNYGWPNVSLGTDYGRYDRESSDLVGEHAGYTAPVFAWVPSIGISNLIQIEGFHRRWDGDLLVTSLKAQSVFRLRLDQMKVLYSEPIYIGQRIRDIAQLKDGTVVLWTDDTQLLFISADVDKLKEYRHSPELISVSLQDDCMYCHHFGPTNVSDFAPSLSNLFERKIASDNFRYSTALRSKEGVWTERALTEFLSNPGEFASGTSMPQLNLNQEVISIVIRDLERIQELERNAQRRKMNSP
jgi:aldose sugar dehydrogenase